MPRGQGQARVCGSLRGWVVGWWGQQPGYPWRLLPITDSNVLESRRPWACMGPATEEELVAGPTLFPLHTHPF